MVFYVFISLLPESPDSKGGENIFFPLLPMWFALKVTIYFVYQKPLIILLKQVFKKKIYCFNSNTHKTN